MLVIPVILSIYAAKYSNWQPYSLIVFGDNLSTWQSKWNSVMTSLICIISQSNSKSLKASAIFIVKENPAFHHDFAVESRVIAYHTKQAISLLCLRDSGNSFSY